MPTTFEVKREFDDSQLYLNQSGMVRYIFDVYPFAGAGGSVSLLSFTDKQGTLIADSVTFAGSTKSGSGSVSGTFATSYDLTAGTITITPNGAGLIFTPLGLNSHATIEIRFTLNRGAKTGVMTTKFDRTVEFDINVGSHPLGVPDFLSNSEQCTGLNIYPGKKRSPPKLENQVRMGPKRVPKPVIPNRN